MKRNLITWLLIGAMSLVFIAGICIFVLFTSEDITYKEAALYGDRSQAEGINITSEIIEKGVLCWKADVTLGEEGTEPQVTADYDYKKSYTSPRTNYNYGPDLGASIYFDNDQVEKTTSASIEMPRNKITRQIIEDAAESTRPGKTHTSKIQLSDYYEYIPLKMLPYEEGSVNVSRYFKIPMPDNVFVEIITKKDNNNELIRYDISPYYFEIETGLTEIQNGEFYLALAGIDFITDSRNPDIKNVQIPVSNELRGIHRIPMGKKIPAKADLKNAHLIYPIPDGAENISLDNSKDGKNLYLAYTDNEGRWFIIIDNKAGKEKAKILLDDQLSISENDDKVIEILEKDSNLLIRLSDWKSFFLLTFEDGKYKVSITEKIDNIGETVTYYNEEKVNIFEIHDFDYNGKKLALITGTEEIYPDPYMYLFIFDEKGLQYEGTVSPTFLSKEMSIAPTKNPVTITLPKGGASK